MSKVTMPEPVAYFYQRDFDKYKDRYTGGIPVITIDQAEAYAEAYAAAKVREALEEAALQSQDREDAERYRWVRSKENECNVEIPTKDAAGYLLPGYGEELDAAIDHARRIEN